MSRSLRLLGLLGILAVAPTSHAAHFTTGAEPASKFGVHEIVLTGNGSVPNPFDTIVRVRFTPPSGDANARTVWAFHDGGETWRARVYPTETGEWSWSSSCQTDPRLNGQSGRFRCEASDLRGRLLVAPNDPRQWITENGRWFLNLNDTSYFLLCAHDTTGAALSDDDARAYVKDAMQRGITSFRSNIAAREKGTEQPERDGWSGYFEDRSRTRPNLGSLRVADRRLRLLLDEFPEAYVQFILFPRGSAYQTDETVWQGMSAVQKERILRYLIARFAAYPQVFWLIVNDAHFAPLTLPPRAGDPLQAPRTRTFPNNCAMSREVGAFLQAHDPWQHPTSTGPARRMPFYFEAEDWATYIHLENDYDASAKTFETYRDAGKPVLLGEDRYEQDHPETYDPKDMRYFQRRLFWSWLLAGGSGNYGGRWWVLQPYSRTGERPTVSIQRKGFTYTDALTGLDSVRYVRDYFASRNIELSGFQPDPTKVSDPGVTAPEDAPKLLRRGNDEFLVYHPNATGTRRDMKADAQMTARVRLDLKDVPGSFQVEWYRALDGTPQDGGTVEGGRVIDLTAPWVGSDVVLRLIRVRPE